MTAVDRRYRELDRMLTALTREGMDRRKASLLIQQHVEQAIAERLDANVTDRLALSRILKETSTRD